MMTKATQKARFADNFKHIIDCNGRIRPYNDPKVTHVYTFGNEEYFTEIMGHIFTRRGWNHRIIPQVTPKHMENGKRICSGRECLPFTSASGAIYTDIMENRPDDELTVYHGFYADNPCQSATWPSVWNIFGEKLGIDNALFMAYADVPNNFFGQGFTFASEIGAALVLGDMLREARYTLRGLTEDHPAALDMFDKETAKVTRSFLSKHPKRGKALAKWAEAVSKIPLRHHKKDVPQVFVFGSAELELMHQPVAEYFVSQGMIPKVMDFSSFIFIITIITYSRHALKRGKLSAKDQASIPSFMLSFFKTGHRFREYMLANRSGLYCRLFDLLRKHYYKLAYKSGLIHPFYTIPFETIAITGDRHMTFNTFSDSPQALGMFLEATQCGGFDGLMHLTTFNCQPAINAQAMIRPLATKTDIPYAAIDMGDCELTANNFKTLETLAVQARRHHRERTGWVN